MPIITPRGLYLRFNEEALSPVLQPLVERGLLEDIFVDAQLWAQLSCHLARLGALIASLLAHDWRLTIAGAALGSLAGQILSEFVHVDAFRRLAMLGCWMSTLAVAAAFLLMHAPGLALALLGVLVATRFEIPDLLTLPLTLPVTRYFLRRTGMLKTDRAFVGVCNQRAHAAGISLEWKLYFDAQG